MVICVGVLRFLKSQLRDFVKNLVEMLVYRTIAPSWSAKRGISQILTQVITTSAAIAIADVVYFVNIALMLCWIGVSGS